MRYNFSADFLKIIPPATNFGEAWENLCFRLLESSDDSLTRFAPPDCGIDIYSRKNRTAFQCKSSERGALGTINAAECINSLATAIEARARIPWTAYNLALNAPLTANGFAKITSFAAERGISQDSIIVLQPEKWDKLCQSNKQAIHDLFDYKVSAADFQVLEAMREGYVEAYVAQAADAIRRAPLQIKISNNRTPIELSLPFSGQLTVGDLVRTVQTLLGISLDKRNFDDLQSSGAPSVSLTIDRLRIPFGRKLSELTPEQRDNLELWIRLTWSEEQPTDDEDPYVVRKLHYLRGFSNDAEKALSQIDRGQQTLDRMENLIQESIWRSSARLRTTAPARSE